MNLPNYLCRLFFKWLSSFVLHFFPIENWTKYLFTVKMQLQIFSRSKCISAKLAQRALACSRSTFSTALRSLFPFSFLWQSLFSFSFLWHTHYQEFQQTHVVPMKINPLIFWINQIWVIGSSYNGIFATKCKRRRQPWNCTVLICFCLLTCFFPSFGLFFVVETFPDLLKTISLFCFCLLTCLLSLFKSFPRQGGLIGTRDFGLAGADLEINDSWELNNFINFI